MWLCPRQESNLRSWFRKPDSFELFYLFRSLLDGCVVNCTHGAPTIFA